MNPKILWLIDKLLNLLDKVWGSIPAIGIGILALVFAVEGKGILFIIFFVLMFTIAFYD